MYLLINIVYTILDHITRLGMDDVGYWLAMHASSPPGRTGEGVRDE